MTQPDVQRYLLEGNPDGPTLTLRGYPTVFPRFLLIAGIVCLLGGAAGVYGIITSPGDEIPIGIAAVGLTLGLGLVFYGRRQLTRPDRILVIDRTAQTLTVRDGRLDPKVIGFRDLGPMKLGVIGRLIVHGTGERERRSHLAIGLSNHEGLVLYVPWSNADLTCFAVTLRHIIGEEYLPRAQPKPQVSA
jgi:hypothetical protein